MACFTTPAALICRRRGRAARVGWSCEVLKRKAAPSAPPIAGNLGVARTMNRNVHGRIVHGEEADAVKKTADRLSALGADGCHTRGWPPRID